MPFLPAHAGLSITFVVLIGLAAGSFLNTVIFRYPKMLEHFWKLDCMDYLKQPLRGKPVKFNLINPQPHCLHCKKQLHKLHTIPLLSYLYLRGRCAYCQSKISPIHPLVEFLTVMVTMAVVLRFGITPVGFFGSILSWGLITLSFIDFRKKILPDTITIPFIWIGLIANVFSCFTSINNAVFGAVAGYLAPWAIAKLFKMLRHKDGMGHGDFKMLSMLGAWLGASMLTNVLLTSVLIALGTNIILAITKKLKPKQPIPFGPYLAIGGWLTLIFGPSLSDWLGNIIR